MEIPEMSEHWKRALAWAAEAMAAEQAQEPMPPLPKKYRPMARDIDLLSAEWVWNEYLDGRFWGQRRGTTG
jgi:hypothetical protein